MSAEPKKGKIGLKAAVAGASSPEELAGILQEIGQRYIVAREQESAFSAAKKEIRAACILALKRLETDSWEWSVGDRRLRATRYDILSVRPTDKLALILVERGLGRLVTRRVVEEINQDELWSAVRRGEVSIDDIRANAVVETTEGFRITELKGGDEPASSDA